MKDTEPNTVIALGIAAFLALIGIGGCNYLISAGDLHDAQAEQIRKEMKREK